jgi:hypothetical protein
MADQYPDPYENVEVFIPAKHLRKVLKKWKGNKMIPVEEVMVGARCVAVVTTPNTVGNA